MPPIAAAGTKVGSSARDVSRRRVRWFERNGPFVEDDNPHRRPGEKTGPVGKYGVIHEKFKWVAVPFVGLPNIGDDQCEDKRRQEASG